MDLLKKLFVGFFILLLSAAIFYLLVNDEKMKDDILRTTLESLGNQVLSAMPEGANKRALEKKLNSFLEQVNNDELTEGQIQSTAASILNIQMQPRGATPQVIETLLTLQIDSVKAPDQTEKAAREQLKKLELAGQIKEMMALQREIERLSREDTSAVEIRENVVFAADSGLKVIISPDILQDHVFIYNPELRHRLEKLQAQNRVSFYNFEAINEFGNAGLKFVAPLLDPNDREALKTYLKRHTPQDSLVFERFLLHPDSIMVWIEMLRQYEKEREEMEELR